MVLVLVPAITANFGFFKRPLANIPLDLFFLLTSWTVPRGGV